MATLNLNTNMWHLTYMVVIYLLCKVVNLVYNAWNDRYEEPLK
jgi:hypothetical protein